MPESPPDPAEHLRTDHLYDDLVGRSVRGGAVTAIAQFAKMAIQFGAVVLLARLVAPEAFGLVAMVAAALAFFELFRDLGLSMATVQRPTITHEEVSALFWVNTAVCVLVFAVICALAPALTIFYGREELTPIAIWLGFGVAIGGLATQHIAILRRQMRFAALSAAEVGAAVIGIIAAVGVAMNGGGLWALVAQRIAWSAALTALSWSLCGWRPGPPARGIGARRLLVFGGNITLASIVSLAARNLDQVLIGWWWGAVPLGFYERANRLLMAPIQNANTPLMAVAMPMLSRLVDNPDRYRAAYLRVLEGVCMVSMPAAALLIAAPDWTVAVLLGSQWAGAAGIVMWLGVAALYQPATNTTNWLFVTQDRTGELVRWSIAGSALRIAAVVAGLPYGAEAVAAAFAVSGLVLHLPLLFHMVGRKGPVRGRDLYAALAPSALVSAMVFCAVYGARTVPGLMPADPLSALGAAFLIAAIASLLGFAGLPRSRRAMHGALALRSVLFGSGARP
jgi:PST family polysaccharide transporter